MDICENPNCPGGAISYESPTADMPEIEVTCEGCGQSWHAPNKLYIDAENREREDEYYDRYER